MHSRPRGIHDRPVAQTPIAVFDFETTGLNPGHDRVVESSRIMVPPSVCVVSSAAAIVGRDLFPRPIRAVGTN